MFFCSENPAFVVVPFLVCYTAEDNCEVVGIVPLHPYFAAKV